MSTPCLDTLRPRTLAKAFRESTARMSGLVLALFFPGTLTRIAGYREQQGGA